MQDTLRLRTLMLAGCAVCNFAQAACESPVLVSPAQSAISEASPRFEWVPVPNADHYLVWLESRLPEGRILLSQEFQTSATYVIPPNPLTNSKATVRLRVKAVCKDNTYAELSARFRIDGDPACRLKAEPVARLDNGQWNVHWEALPSAQRYEIRVHAVEDGRPRFLRDTRENATSVGPLQAGAWLFAVQPVCMGLKGVTHWIAVESH